MSYVSTGVEPGSAKWLEERRKYICASDAPKILGFSRWGSADDVCFEKWGEAPKVEMTPAMERGHILQDPIAHAYQMATGETLLPEVFMVHPDLDWMAATPDARIKGKKKNVQIKTHSDWLLDEYGPSGSDIYPDAERIQVLHEMSVLGNTSADLAVLFAEDQAFRVLVDMIKSGIVSVDDMGKYILEKMDLRVYPVEADSDLQLTIIDEEHKFLEKCVKPHELPATSPVRKDSGDIRVATPEEAAQSEEVKRWWLLNKKSELQLEENKASMIGMIGDDSGIDFGGGIKITYKKAKDTVVDVTDWEAIAAELGITDELMKKHTGERVTRQGTRRFNVPHAKWKKDL